MSNIRVHVVLDVLCFFAEGRLDRKRYGQTVTPSNRLQYDSDNSGGVDFTETWTGQLDGEWLVTYASADDAAIDVSSPGGTLTLLENRVEAVALTASFCDGQSDTDDLYANMRYTTPFDYDLGASTGAPITYVQASGEVCFSVRLYSQAVVEQFQFLVRFDESLLDCTSAACGTFVGGAAWSTFGAEKVAMVADRGQITFYSLADVSSAGQSGELAIGDVCVGVLGAGTLVLDVQKQYHVDAASGGSDRECSGVYLYLDGTSCFSRTPSVSFDVQPVAGRRLSQPPARQLAEASSRLVPLNVLNDGVNSAQMNIGDCEEVLGVSQQISTFGEAVARDHFAGMDPEVAVGYNPIMDFFDGSTTQFLDSRDVSYCIRYVGKRLRFVYNVSL